MPTHVALLRGINLGGRNRVAMADLRALVAGLGHADVSTYIQSGNVLFSAPAGAPGTSAIADEMTAAIASDLGVTAPVVVLTRDELADVVRANPFPGESNHKCLHAVFRPGPADQDLLDRITAAVSAATAKGSRDSAKSIGRTLYLHTPDGYGNSDLAKALLRLTGTPQAGTGTARNWATVLRLLELSRDRTG
ncbi:MAG: DUF1697 domain-containing protein [Nocardiopsaceae bacterium]|nr:DUF1697 domain-containing protein [Nocardiopsaceae bacterium]